MTAKGHGREALLRLFAAVSRDVPDRSLPPAQGFCACRVPVPNGAYLGTVQCRCLAVIEPRRPWTGDTENAK